MPSSGRQTESFSNGVLIEFSCSTGETDNQIVEDVSRALNAVDQAKQALEFHCTPKDSFKRLLEGIDVFRATTGAMAEVCPSLTIIKSIS
jgi:hypothetical protein